MRTLRANFLRLGGLFHKEQRDRDLADELESHLQMHIEDNLRSGMSPSEARRQALIKLGGLEQTKEKYRDRRTIRRLETLVQDVRFGLRMLRKNPGFTTIAVLTLALGIGANTAIFTVVNSVLLRPLPFPDADRLVRLWVTPPPSYRILKMANSVLDLKDWQNQNQVFEGIAAYTSANFNLRGAENPERVVGAYVTANFFDVMGMRPILGRGFLSDEDVKGREHVAVLSNDLWKAMFSGNPYVIGQTIRLNSTSFDIVGVMPDNFRFPSSDAQLWAPFVSTPEQEATRGTHFLQAVARMKTGITQTAAQSEMNAIMSRMSQQNVQDAFFSGVYIEGLEEAVVEDVRGSLSILLAAVGLVFLMACSNVINLLLARAVGRQREIYIRASLGATRGRLWRQFFTESLLLALMGAAFAWIFAAWGTMLLVKVSPQNLPSIQKISPDLHVFSFTIILSILAALSMCLGMALQSSNINLAGNLNEGSAKNDSSRAHGRARGALVIGQIATAVTLLIGAMLLIKSLDRLLRVNPGFEPQHVLTMRIALPTIKYSPTHPESGFYQPLLENVERIPGIQAAGLISLLPVQSGGNTNSFHIEGRPKPSASEEPFAELRAASPDYFRALSIPLIRGRYFTENDNAAAPMVVIINKALADQYFTNEDPLGKRLLILLNGDKGTTPIPIVGVVGNTRQFGLAEPPHPETDICFLQVRSVGLLAPYVQTMSLVVRTTGDPTIVTSAIRDAVQKVDPDQPVFNVQTMEEVISTSVDNRRFNMLLLGTFAGVGLVLAIIGIYGVISYGVRQRTHEIGIRTALGAQRSDVLKMILGGGMKLVLIGLVIGLAAAVGLTRLMRSLLYGITPTDPLTFAGVAILLMAVALLACYIPARRATRIDPAVALRHE